MADTAPKPPELPRPELPKPKSPEEVDALVVPISGKAQREVDDAVLPQEERKKVAPARRPPSRKLQPGDLICGECGEGNNETRKFCSRCGHTLATAQQVKRAWWRRLIPKGGAKVRKSGERPNTAGSRGGSKFGMWVKSTFRVVRRVVAVILLVGGLLYGVFAPFRAFVNERVLAVKAGAERIIFPEYTPVLPTGIDAPIGLPDHPGAMASDGFSNTYWAAPMSDGGAEPVLVLSFDSSADIGRVIIRNGASDTFQARHRAKRLHLVFSTGKTSDLDLIDAPDPQQLDVENGEGATSVEIHVVDIFRAVKGTEVALTEIELFNES